MSQARELADVASGNTTERILAGRKNLIINGAMQVAQRGTSFSHNGARIKYPVDRFKMTVYGTGFAIPTGGTSAQVNLTDSDSESLGFSNAIRFTPASDSKVCYLDQRIEDVSRLAGKTITFSYYARINTGTFSIPNDGRVSQNFGTSGSAEINAYADFDNNVLTTSWKRISYSLTLPSVVGKTINAGNYTQVRLFHTADLSSLGWLEVTGVQLELGSQATDFEYRSYGEELALCKRYYEIAINGAKFENTFGLLKGASTTQAIGVYYFDVEKRAKPTITTSGIPVVYIGGPGYVPDSVTSTNAGTLGGRFIVNDTVYTASQAYHIDINTFSLAADAEL